MRFLSLTCLLLGLAAAGLCAYAWQLRARLAATEVRREALETDAVRLRAELGELRSRPVALPPPPAGPPRAGEGGDEHAGPELGGPPPRGPETRGRRAAFMQSPEMQRLMQLDRRDNLDGRYGALFRKLNLPPGQLDRLKDLLVERDAVAGDVYEAARTIGMNFRDNRAEIQKQIADAQAGIDATIQSTFGPGVLQQYQQYEQTSGQRGVVGALERRLSYTPNPLSADQADRLVALMSGAGAAGSIPVPGAAGPGPRNLVAVSDEVLAQSRSFLSDAQLAALRQMRDDAQLRDQLRREAQEKMQQLRNSAPGS